MREPAAPPVLRATKRAKRSISPALRDLDGVGTRRQLAERGFGPAQVAAHLAAGTWHRIGPAIVLHDAAPTLEQLHRICLLNCGPHALLTSFTALERIGLRGWARAEVHVLAPGGVARPEIPGLRLHRVREWTRVRSEGARLHQRADALILAASSFDRPRAAVGIVASAAQQRMVPVQQVREALIAAPRTRHRAALLRAVLDMGQGGEALRAIDFVRLCTRYRLPRPRFEAVRTLRGKRCYFDVQWRLADGRILAVEVEAAHHLTVAQWCSDQLGEIEVESSGAIVLRVPAVIVREEPWLVAERLHRILGPETAG